MDRRAGLRRSPGTAAAGGVRPAAREAVAYTALAEIDGALLRDRYGRFAWLARRVAGKAKETETEPCHMPRFGEAVAHAAALHGEDALSQDGRKAVASWLDYDRTYDRPRREVRDWPARADAVLADRTGLGRAEPLLAGARAMQAEGSPHAPHLAAMPEECGKLVEAADRLENALAEIETAQADRLQKIAGQAAEPTGGIASGTAGQDDPAERGRLARDRARVEAFLDLARKRLDERDSMDGLPLKVRAMARLPLTPEAWKQDADAVLAEAKALGQDIPEEKLEAHLDAPGARPDAIDEHAAKIAKRIREDEEARAAERQRLADEQALVEAERLRLEEERKQEWSEGGGMSMS